jgi:hypothetical protein
LVWFIEDFVSTKFLSDALSLLGLGPSALAFSYAIDASTRAAMPAREKERWIEFFIYRRCSVSAE